MANLPHDEILTGDNFRVQIPGCETSANNVVSVDCDPIEIHVKDVTQGGEAEWRTLVGSIPNYGYARFVFRVDQQNQAADIADWMNQARTGADVRKDITIKLISRNGSDARDYNLMVCMPCSYNAGTVGVDGESATVELVVKPQYIEIMPGSNNMT
jgi:phage tail-like protein